MKKIAFLFVVLALGCGGKKSSTPKKEASKAPVARPKRGTSPKASPQDPPKASPKTPAKAPAPAVSKKETLSKEELDLVKGLTTAFINKTINGKVDQLVDAMVKKLGKKVVVSTWPIFAKGAIKTITATGVKVTVDLLFAELDKRVTKALLEEVVRPMIEKAAKAALDNAFAKMKR